MRNLVEINEIYLPRSLKTLSEFLFEFWPFLSVFLSNQSDLGSVKLNHILHSYWNSVYLKSSILKSNFRAIPTVTPVLFLQNRIQRFSKYILGGHPCDMNVLKKSGSYEGAPLVIWWNLMNLKLGVIFNLGSLYCYSCQMIVSAVFKTSAKHYNMQGSSHFHAIILISSQQKVPRWNGLQWCWW